MSIDTTTGISPPPIDATKCKPSSNAMIVTTTSSQMFGEMQNQTVRAAKATSEPMFRRFLPGRTSGFELIRADNFKNAMIEPVNVTAPMKTPMKTSAW